MILKRILEGRKVAVLVETEYIPEELRYYENFFSELGAQVDFMTYLWGHKERIIVSDVDAVDKKPEYMLVRKEIADANPNDYAIVLTAANYVAVRLREIPPMGSLGNAGLVRSPAAVRFMASAMANPAVIKGALCHALWILTPTPELLKGRKVICHTVVLADVVNAGAEYVPEPSHVVIDRDLVTGRSAADLEAYCDAIIRAYQDITENPIK